MNDLEPIGDLQHPVVRRETCSLAAVRRIAAMLNQDPDKWSEGDLLPRGWQFIQTGNTWFAENEKIERRAMGDTLEEAAEAAPFVRPEAARVSPPIGLTFEADPARTIQSSGTSNMERRCG